ncbi:DUF2993 domain-containing protein [Natronosporangium hydrolyticum]|uniref:DUF2993 domain-containing protein n=1 Tax=Natronosporangium hydrolyticum TaxID=2811111 RepID=A0A895YED8_9ACTN|nr:DUF2993 domain-containing protein [Natronosporangium hydrolyticum]QSB14525.1 DUF2993 domain-containing protein [Natronosporangium hydrolyticum]
MRRVVWLVVAGLLLIGVVVADRVGESVAESIVADQIEQELAANGVSTDPPETSVDRNPFLTQVFAGRYHSITVRLRNVGTAELELAEVDLVATGVSAPLGTLLSRDGEIVADQLAGTTTIDYDDLLDLPELAGLELGGLDLSRLELAGGDDGQLQVRVPAELFSLDLVLAGTAEVTVANGAVALAVTSLEVAEPADLPPGADAVLDQTAEQLSLAVPLPALPYDLRLDEVAVTSAGLAVVVSGEQVTLAQLHG